MAVSNTETVGFADQVIQLMQDNAVDLKEKGLDVANWITELTGEKNAAVTEGGKQDEMQAALKAQTVTSKNAHKTLYNSGSTKLDAITGVLGKNTPQAKQAAKLRSAVNKQYNKKKKDNPDS